MTRDELDRLARADPVPPGSLAARPAPPAPAGGPDRRPPRWRRTAGPVLAGLGALALAALVAVLLVVTGGEDPPPATAPATPAFDGTLRAALLERPQVAEDVTEVGDIGGDIDPASTRLALRRPAGDWYAGRARGFPGSVCLWHAVPRGELVCAGPDSFAQFGLVVVRWFPRGATGPLATRTSELVGIAPDGVTSVAIGDRVVPVVANVFTATVIGPPPTVAGVIGPAAVAMPDNGGGSSTVFSTGTDEDGDPPPPVATIALQWNGRNPEAAPGVPPDPLVRGTLDQAVRAVPFRLMVPGAPPPGERTVMWARDDPRLIPHASISYAPPRPGAGIVLLESAAGTTPVGDAVRERRVVHAGRPMFVVEPGPATEMRVRVVIDGTDVRISGGLTRDEALDLAASLRPAG